LITTYNNKIHRTVKTKPIDDVKKENELKLISTVYCKMYTYIPASNSIPKYRIENYDRVSKFKNKFEIGLKEVIGAPNNFK